MEKRNVVSFRGKPSEVFETEPNLPPSVEEDYLDPVYCTGGTAGQLQKSLLHSLLCKNVKQHGAASLASNLMLLLAIVMMIVIPGGMFTANHAIVFTSIGLLTIIAIAAFFNRRDHVNIAGLLLALGCDLAIIIDILLKSCWPHHHYHELI